MKNIIAKTLIKGAFVALLMLCAVMSAKSQAFTATYGYDANGNRISASVIYLSTSLKSAVATKNLNQVIKSDSLKSVDTTNLPHQGWNNPLTESLKNMELKLYPNPTHGMLILEISGLKDDQLSGVKNNVSILDLEGRQLSQTALTSKYMVIDLSKYENGAYFLRINILNEIKEYKIIKE